MSAAPSEPPRWSARLHPVADGPGEPTVAELRATHVGTAARTHRLQHDRRKLTVRERLDLLFDDDTFVETEALHGVASQRPSVVTGSGLVDGRLVFVYAQDFGVAGGSVGSLESAKICRVIDAAVSAGAPLVALADGGGARIQEGARALDGYGRIFRRHVAASGVVPQVSVVLGPCAGGAAYAPALCDFVFMTEETSYLYLTGPDVVAAVTGETLTHQELGGARVHAGTSGLACATAPDEESCLLDVRALLALLPSDSSDIDGPPAPPSAADVRPALASLVPEDPRTPYDVRLVVREIVDDGYLYELFPEWAPNIVIGFAELGGTRVGCIANQPLHLAGAIDAEASDKAARFVGFCDAFGIPILSFVDVPGFLPGAAQERLGAIRRGAKLLHAYCRASTPRVQLILRKAIGGAYIVMDSRSVGSDLSFAWPGNQVAVMGAEGAVDVIHRRHLASCVDPVRERAALVAAYEDDLMGPFAAATHGLVDDVVDPGLTRSVLLRALATVHDKRPGPPRWSKHTNLPT